VAGRNPNTLAASARRSLAGQRAARTWAVHATTLRRIVAKRPCITNRLGEGSTGNLVGLSIPMSTPNLNRTSVRDGLTNVVRVVLGSGFVHTSVDGVISRLGFPNGFVSRVRNFAGASFPNRLADRVSPSLGFPNRLANSVTNVASASFPNRLADRVGPRLGFPNRLANGVTNVASAGFPHRLADGVGPRLGFPNRLANGVANLLLTLLAYMASYVDDPIFTDPIVDRAATGFALAFPFHASDRFHHGMAMLLVTARCTAIVPCCSAVTCLGYRR